MRKKNLLLFERKVKCLQGIIVIQKLAYITPPLVTVVWWLSNLSILVVDTFLLSCIGTGSIPQLGVLPAPRAITSVATMNLHEISQAGAHPVIPLPHANTLTSPGLLTHRVQAPSVTQGAHTMLIHQVHTPPVTQWPQTQDQSQGMILSSALQPVPARLVCRIRAGEFIEMRDLLTDNLSLHDQLEAVQGPLLNAVTAGALRPRLREVPSLISWVSCFTTYVAVRTQDSFTRDMLTYCRLVIREALMHGGQGWQEYDRNFRSQAAIDRSLRWSSLLPDLQASTTLGQRTTTGVHCSLCRGVDHVATQCALGFMQQPLTPQPAVGVTSSTMSGGSRRPGQPRSRPICNLWNAGRCIYPGTCSFRHVCATCYQRHQAMDCQQTPPDSPYRHGIHRPPSSGSAVAGR